MCAEDSCIVEGRCSQTQFTILIATRGYKRHSRMSWHQRSARSCKTPLVQTSSPVSETTVCISKAIDAMSGEGFLNTQRNSTSYYFIDLELCDLDLSTY